MLKITDNPPVMFPAVSSVAELQGIWWVGHTKARFEKAFAWDLMAAGIPYFLPMVERSIFSGGRKRRLMSPLFPSYVFFCGNEEVRYRALVTDRLCQVIATKEQEKLVAELTSLDRAVRGQAALDPYPFLGIGKRVRVARGSLMGVEGTVTERDSITRLVLQVSMLGQAVSVQIDADVLEPLES